MRGDGVVVADLTIARCFHERLLGLMGRAPLGPGRALLLRPCRCIHTCFMRFPLDVIFLDAGNRVVRRVDHVRPWRAVWGGMRAESVVEVASGWLPADAVKPGDPLTFFPQ
jgi:uncharacterized membrane protein (UPF0127 family)